jgi:glutaconate CoA-transferase subunit B
VSSGQTQTAYTLSELMVTAAAREIHDGEVVFVGMRLPLLAFMVAKRGHAPNAIGLFDNGVIRDTPASEFIYTMGDSQNIQGAISCLDMMGVMSLLQSGRVDLGFLGAAEVDKFGNLNSTQVRTDDGHGPPHFGRLPGSGGACDIASCAKRFVVLLDHAKRRLPERVSYITSPGYGDGRRWRQRVGLPRGGPSACITTKAVLRYYDAASAERPSFARGQAPEDGEAYLESVHPGVTVPDVVASTGWKLRVPENVSETMPPTPEELAAIRNYDKQGFWTK